MNLSDVWSRLIRLLLNSLCFFSLVSPESWLPSNFFNPFLSFGLLRFHLSCDLLIIEPFLMSFLLSSFFFLWVCESGADFISLVFLSIHFLSSSFSSFSFSLSSASLYLVYLPTHSMHDKEHESIIEQSFWWWRWRDEEAVAGKRNVAGKWQKQTTEKSII